MIQRIITVIVRLVLAFWLITGLLRVVRLVLEIVDLQRMLESETK